MLSIHFVSLWFPVLFHRVFDILKSTFEMFDFSSQFPFLASWGGAHSSLIVINDSLFLSFMSPLAIIYCFFLLSFISSFTIFLFPLLSFQWSFEIVNFSSQISFDWTWSCWTFKSPFIFFNKFVLLILKGDCTSIVSLPDIIIFLLNISEFFWKAPIFIQGFICSSWCLISFWIYLLSQPLDFLFIIFLRCSHSAIPLSIDSFDLTTICGCWDWWS